jgi:fumarate reductase subunit C
MITIIQLTIITLFFLVAVTSLYFLIIAGILCITPGTGKQKPRRIIQNMWYANIGFGIICLSFLTLFILGTVMGVLSL